MAESPVIEFVTTSDDETYLKDFVKASFQMLTEEKEKEKETEKKFEYKFISIKKTDGTSETGPTGQTEPVQNTKIWTLDELEEYFFSITPKEVTQDPALTLGEIQMDSKLDGMGYVIKNYKWKVSSIFFKKNHSLAHFILLQTLSCC